VFQLIKTPQAPSHPFLYPTSPASMANRTFAMSSRPCSQHFRPDWNWNMPVAALFPVFRYVLLSLLHFLTVVIAKLWQVNFLFWS